MGVLLVDVAMQIPVSNLRWMLNTSADKFVSYFYKSAVEYEQGMRKRPPSTFGAALVQEYKKRGFTQYSLAKKIGRSTRYLNNLEHDRSEPRFTTILILADALDMEPGALVNAAAELSWAAMIEKETVPGETEGE